MFNRSPFLLSFPVFGLVFTLFLLGAMYKGLPGLKQLVGDSRLMNEPLDTVASQSDQPLGIDNFTAVVSESNEEISQTGIEAKMKDSTLLDEFSGWVIEDTPAVVQAGMAVLPWDQVAVAPEVVVDPLFDAFVLSVLNGQSEVPVGVYIANKFALPVLQQPAGDATFVSPKDGTVTQFRSAAEQGVTGLLAHNYLSGLLFYNLEIGDEVRIVYGDGQYKRYQIDLLDQYQRLDFTRLNGDFIDLETNHRESSNQVFARYYTGSEHVTFQTCLERNGNPSWGLSFWIASPLQ